MTIHTLLRRAGAALACALALGGAAARGTDPAMPGEILLKLKSTAALQPLLSKYSLTLVNSLGARPLFRVKVVGNTDPAAVIAQLLLEPDVQIAEPNPRNQSPEARKNIFWAIGTEAEYRVQWAPQAMNLPAAQARSSGAGVRVAVLDTGVDLTHPALAGRLLPGRDWVDGDNDPSEGGSSADPGFGHGTHVAGLVALAAPGAKIMPLRVLDAQGSGHMWAIFEAMLYAADPDGNPATDDGAQVINLSLGTLSRTQLVDTLSQIVSCNPPARGPAFDLSDPGYNGDKARCKSRPGAVVVAAAGNDGDGKTKEFPAAESAYGLIAVAASDADRHIALFSNSGNWINVAAPGDHITSLSPGGGYATWSGTSMAAPLTAGAVALLRQLNRTITPKDIELRVGDTAGLLCGGTKLLQVDALALLNGVPGPVLPCP